MFPARLTPSPGRLVALALGALIAWTLLGVQTGDGSSVAPLRRAAAVGESAGAATADLESPSDAVSVAGPVELARPGLPAGSTVLAADASGAARPAEHPSAKDRRSGPGSIRPASRRHGVLGRRVRGRRSSALRCLVRHRGTLLRVPAGSPIRRCPAAGRDRHAVARGHASTSRSSTRRARSPRSATNSNQFNAEAFVDDAGGRRRGRCGSTPTRRDRRARSGCGPSSRTRAGAAGRPRRPLLPNLQARAAVRVRLHRAGQPAQRLYPPDTVNPPLDVAGVHPLSCARRRGGAGRGRRRRGARCLRLTSGPINVGDGPFDMRFTSSATSSTATADAGVPARARCPGHPLQRRHDRARAPPARTSSTRPTPTSTTTQILTYELFAVADGARADSRRRAPAPSRASARPTSSSATGGSFGQEPAGRLRRGRHARRGNCFSPDDGLLGADRAAGATSTAGSGPASTSSSAATATGSTSCARPSTRANHILETDETDNTTYALIRIVGRNVDVIERGQGTDPWDRHKVVFEGDGPASVR